MTLISGTSTKIHLRTSGPITTIISVAKTRCLMKRIILHRLHAGQILGAIAIMSPIALALDAIIIDDSAQSILRPALADTTRGLSHTQMAVDQACHHQEIHHQPALRSVHAVPVAETGPLGMHGTQRMYPMTWSFQTAQCAARTRTSEPDTDPDTITSHLRQTPAHAATLTTPISANLRENSPHPRKSAMKATTDAHQNPANQPPADAAKPKPDPGPDLQVPNSESSSSTQPIPQLQSLTHRNMPLPHPHQEDHPATGMMPI